ncbi:hypothetical protein [Paenibacillus gansuensis]|uniref:Flp pilus-assembly TadG-like N-terminal domain-containing protein n=1 Tax=Paenibacillus gansuensis TaxID=306542 RepID=A0ABW5PKX5_9BACL
MKPTNKFMLSIINNQRGGISIMLCSLIALVFCISAMVISIDFARISTQKNKIKNYLNNALHAASLSIDEISLSKGLVRLDITTNGKKAQDMFYIYLRKNLHLDNNNKALATSVLPTDSTVEVKELVYINYEDSILVNLLGGSTSCSYSSLGKSITCNITENAGQPNEISRKITESIVGPSVVSIIAADHDGIGLLSDERLLITGVQELRFFKK